MNAVERKAWACNVCGALSQNEGEAEKCCRDKSYKCNVCGTECAEPPWHPKGMQEGKCSQCYYKGESQRRWDEAAKIKPEDWKGPVHIDDTNRYYSDVDEAIEAWWNSLKTGVPKVYGCKVRVWSFDLYTEMAERLDDEMEDGSDHLPSAMIGELQKTIDEFTQGIKIWDYDTKSPIDISEDLKALEEEHKNA